MIWPNPIYKSRILLPFTRVPSGCGWHEVPGGGINPICLSYLRQRAPQRKWAPGNARAVVPPHPLFVWQLLPSPVYGRRWHEVPDEGKTSFIRLPSLTSPCLLLLPPSAALIYVVNVLTLGACDNEPFSCYQLLRHKRPQTIMPLLSHDFLSQIE